MFTFILYVYGLSSVILVLSVEDSQQHNNNNNDDENTRNDKIMRYFKIYISE